MPQEGLHLDWCSYEAAKYAVEHWHYSGTMPAGKTVKIGVWEDGDFIGVVIFSRGANNNAGKPYGLQQTELCELTRVALTEHSVPVTRILSVALRLLQQHSSDLRLVFSYADPEQAHVGVVYQAGNWIYSGVTRTGPQVLTPTGWLHGRSAVSRYGSVAGMPQKYTGKHKYLMPLDDDMREQIAPLAKPYPKREQE